MTTEILIFDGFDDLDAFGPFEVLTGAGFDTRFVTIEPADIVTSAHGARVVPDGVLGDPDLVIVPGGGWNDRDGKGAYYEARRGLDHARARRSGTSGAAGSAPCAPARCCSPRPASSTGRPAITHHSAIEDLRSARRADRRRAPASSTTATSSPPPASRRVSTWRCTSSRQVKGDAAAAAQADEIEWTQMSLASTSG